ncbi:hypothetical protein M5D96_005948, partial [Drosophila gunungcola]
CRPKNVWSKFADRWEALRQPPIIQQPANEKRCKRNVNIIFKTSLGLRSSPSQSVVKNS